MAPTSALTLYELAAADPAIRFSPHCWKTRMALAHKGLEATRIPWRFTDKPMIAFSGQELVPVLVDGGHTVSDSWRIALHLESRVPQAPALFGAGEAVPLARFVNAWADTILLPAIAKLIVLRIHENAAEADKAYFRASREKRFGRSLEEVVADPGARTAEFRAALAPLRLVLREREYLAGAAPAYSDYCVFGMFMWMRCIAGLDPLEPDDPVAVWRERLLDRFDGMARNAPAVPPVAAAAHT